MKEVVGMTVYPTLTRTNYGDWALLMKVILQARGLWRAVEHGVNVDDEAEYRDDRMAMEAILCAVPPEMLASLTKKTTAKAAWDAIKTVKMGVECVRKANAQVLRQEFEGIRFKDGESVEEFLMRLTGMVNNMSLLGDTITDEEAVRKLLRVVPKRYSQIAVSMETCMDIDDMSIEDVIARLRAAEDRLDADDDGGSGSISGRKLLLSEEEWMARMRK